MKKYHTTGILIGKPDKLHPSSKTIAPGYPMFQPQEPHSHKKVSLTGVLYPTISNFGLAAIPYLP